MLNELMPEIGAEQLYKCIYREIAKSWKFAENLTQKRHNYAVNNDYLKM